MNNERNDNTPAPSCNCQTHAAQCACGPECGCGASCNCTQASRCAPGCGCAD